MERFQGPGQSIPASTRIDTQKEA